MLNQQLPEWLAQAAAAHCRLPVVFSGLQTEIWPEVQQFLQQHSDKTLYWIGPGAPEHALVPSRQHKQLGAECDLLIINAEQGFPADLVAACSGALKAGGLWLLLIPEPDAWQQSANPAHRHLLPYPLDAEQHQGYFLRFFWQQLQGCDVGWLTTKTIERQPKFPTITPAVTPSEPYASDEQQEAVTAILRVVSGHRHRPLVLSAHRGRGKSAALGIAAAQLAEQGKAKLILTAPNQAAARICQQHFQANCAETLHDALQFMPVDALLRQWPAADLLLIDEAAAIPTPQLQQLTQQYSRIVFATTEHGYEGTGRGFQLRFQQYLASHRPGWRKLHLQQPIRYHQQDPLEQLIFRCFLLANDGTDGTISPDDIEPSDGVLQQFQARDLLEQPKVLAELFQLLSLAHYQTHVDDLVALLDNPTLRVHAMYLQDQLIGCALVSLEGDIPEPLAQHIYKGTRRLQGHMLPQSLAFHLQRPELATLPAARIQRIVVHPELQGRGIGTELLQHLAAHYQQTDRLLGTSFAASEAVVRFWHKSGFVPVRLGIKADHASGEHSLLMLKPSGSEQKLMSQLENSFRHQLYEQIPIFYRQLDPALLRRLVTPPRKALSKQDNEALQLFSNQQRPFELVYSQLRHWLNQNLDYLSDKDAAYLIAQFWLQLSWQEMAQRFELTGKKQVIAKTQQIVAKVLSEMT
ncbi:GNAT family N-acetyltransferase [Alkalimonas collagenimarina]|uniref:tRNA(Met) cytidine acetyltransferase TmcA n=1 Tax=Alkalimonas collagenimarina TaxID=400390 RepID=A0ABT9GXF7_9GAMM|nr:GNAT family N-acetyltransferase [Alkalimonas collagenimarina]MDP4535736.1 GNAT family N-acetyltransferase [Alkalimonas collagenimarina]